jgi:D-serine deaminase-like pyridoxal phosphate-dependent protein
MDYRSTPSVQINMNIVEDNIKNAVEVLGACGITHRPHIKVHKSIVLAGLQQRLGCKGITCAKLGEAEVMADGGIGDILLAYPLIGADKLERYRLLVGRDGLCIRTVINSTTGAKGLSDLGSSMGCRLPVLIELDGHINRGGVKPGEALRAFAKAVKDLPGIEIEGLQYYGGDIYGCKTKEEIRLRSKCERDEILTSADMLSSFGFPMQILSGGSSFSLHCPEELKGLTEVRAGNYIFNDNALFGLGIVRQEDCALRIYTTVVSRPDGETAIIDAGSKTLTTDTVVSRPGYGYIVESPGALVYKLNEEHGFVRNDEGLDWEVGDILTIIPNHACTIPNLCDEIYGVRDGRLEMPIAIDARGKNR